MRTTQIKIAQYIGSLYGRYIMGELETKKEFAASAPKYHCSAPSPLVNPYRTPKT
jgi:hypothetical protein